MFLTPIISKMRLLVSVLAVCMLLSSCSDKVLRSAQDESPPPHARAVVVGNDTVAMVTTVSVGKKSQVSIAVGGHNNNPVATRTDNTGRNASEGANGGNSQPTTTNSVPAWALVLLLLTGAGGGAWLWHKWQT